MRPAPKSARTEPASKGWRAVLASTVRNFGADRISATAAGVTFFFLLALFPAVSAFASLFGLVASVGDARREVAQFAGLLPAGAVTVLSDALTRFSATGSGTLGIALAISLSVSIWSANAGIKALIDGLNVAYEARERRNLVSLTLTSLVLTASLMLLTVAGLAATLEAPGVLARLGVKDTGLLTLLRWPALLLLVTVLLSALYTLGPCRPRPHWRWITPGSALAAFGWMLMSDLFSWYVANFGHYDKTYGPFGAIVGFLTWVWLSVMVILFGAELNREIERRSQPAGASPRRPDQS